MITITHRSDSRPLDITQLGDAALCRRCRNSLAIAANTYRMLTRSMWRALAKYRQQLINNGSRLGVLEELVSIPDTQHGCQMGVILRYHHSQWASKGSPRMLLGERPNMIRST